MADRGASARGDCTHLALVIAFTVGATISVLVAYGIHNIGTSSGANTQAWLVYTAIGADLFSDGLATGAGSAINFQLGILIAVVQLFAIFPVYSLPRLTFVNVLYQSGDELLLHSASFLGFCSVL